jgi:uncharacterized protein DUF2752
MTWRWRATCSAALLAILAWFPLPAQPAIRLCGFYWLTGLSCPLCGLTHGVFALAKGHWLEALHWNALSPLGFAMLFSLIWDHPLRARLWTAGIAMFGVYGLYRIIASVEIFVGS